MSRRRKGRKSRAEGLAGDEAYASAKRQALALLKKGFHMGGLARRDRDELHDRKSLRDPKQP